MKQENIRNVAIIAHVDHGKTTLVDRLLWASHVFRENQQVEERVLDSNDQERERGITILSKNISITYKGVKINVIDTPGHADFGGEVERVLNMADGALLIVDAYEGPKPQTRFVLSHALERGLRIVVVVNKIDRPNADPEGAVDKVFDLMVELGASDEQLDFPVVYASAVNGYARREPDDGNMDMVPLLDTILDEIPAPDVDIDGPVALEHYPHRPLQLRGPHRRGPLVLWHAAREGAGARCEARRGRAPRADSQGVHLRKPWQGRGHGR